MAGTRWALFLLLTVASVGIQQQSFVPAPALAESHQTTDQNHPALSHRPPPSPAQGQIKEGQMKLDVVVTDESGRPVAGLEQKDFALLDNKKPRPILSFRAVDGVLGVGITDPAVEVILVVDVTNTPVEVVGYERQQIEQFLRRNGGRLMQPTSLMIFDDQGVKRLPRPTRDGNQFADELKKAEATTFLVPITTQTEADRVTMSLNALERITEAGGTKAGRTMVIWVGVGWPMLEGPRYQLSRQDYAGTFDRVVTTSRGLREARITLYSVYPASPATTDEPDVQYYRSLLKGAPSVNQVRPGDLALPVLAIHSGGRALVAPGDLGDQIASCIAEAKSYYVLSFDPVTAKHVDEYHELTVHVDRPQLKARTSAGYYAEPAFQFQLPALAGQH